jgi:hypothetical protein
MSLLAEELVEEWLNRQGYFTIRGIKIGVDELDLLAIKPDGKGTLECRHLEVTASTNPISYISRLPKDVQKKTGRKATSAKMTPQELVAGVKEWVEKKFDKPRKIKLMNDLYKGTWTRELVVHAVKHPEELELIKKQGITIHHLSSIVQELKEKNMVVQSASGTNLVELVHL